MNDDMVFRSFAVVGPGNFGNFIIAELLQLITAGSVSSVTVVSRSVCISRFLCAPVSLIYTRERQGCKGVPP